MNYEDLKQDIKRIAEIADGVPEMYRVPCFQVLLQHFVASAMKQTVLSEDETTEDRKDEDKSRNDRETSSIPTPSQMRVFMQKTGVTEEDLNRVMIYADNEVHFVLEPSTQKIARGQIEWALLIALRNGITTNNFSVDPETVRSICQEKGFYDKPNFTKHFRTPKNAALFQGDMEGQGEPQRLSGEGQKELGKLVKKLAADGS